MTKDKSQVSFKAEKEKYSANGLYFKPGNKPCQLHLHLNKCQIDPININGSATLLISTATGPICITGKRSDVAAKLWELLAKVDPLTVQKINQSISNLQGIANLANTDDAGPDVEVMAHHTADLLAEVLADVLKE